MGIRRDPIIAWLTDWLKYNCKYNISYIYSSNPTMDYNWLGDHDPNTIDANLAEIDFDDFKNEDLQNAYAYSLQSYVSISSPDSK